MVTTEQQSHLEGQFVVFRLAEEHYGIPIGSVKEIIVLDTATRLPQMPEFMEGIIDLRGRIIPVVNLRKRFGLPPQVERSTNRTVVAEIGEIEAGVLVDDVVGVVRVSAGSIQPPPDMLSAGAAVVSGVARVADRLVILLDPDLMLGQQEQELLQQQALPLTLG